jgi:signal transduction histidine kinase
MLLGFIASCITVAYFPKLKTKTENVVSKLLYKNKYQYQDELLKFIEKMVLIPYEDKLVSETINVLKKGFGVEKAVIFIRDMFMDDYRIKVQIGMKNDEQIKIKMDNDLVLWLKDNNDIFIKGETDNIDNRNMVINSGKVLEQIGCDLCVPIKLEKDLIGFIILGHKMSKEMFSIDDLGILHRYGTQLAVALDYKRIEAELRKDQQLADIGIMAMEISHEMRNLLQMPQTFIDLAKERANDVDFMTNFRAGALDRMKVISSKLFDIMYFGKERPLNIGYVNINELMDANLLAHDYTIKSRNIEIAKEYNELAIVVGDKEQLTQLFNNIIINSLDAMKGRTGKIRIRTTKNTDLTKEMQDKSKEWIRVEIKDDGSGIPDHVMKKLFTPFITTKSMGGLKRGGTGLGLAVVKKVVSAHKGHITVHSKEDKGTTFIVDLPVDVKDKYSVPPIHGEPWEYKE